MDTPKLPDSLKEAGQAYYDALVKLGLDPEGLLWAYDNQAAEFRLWLVWSGLDRYGPFAMSKLLFRAYNASALPREVDPFSVYVVAPEHRIGDMARQMADAYKATEGRDNLDQIVIALAAPDGQKDSMLHETRFGWVYHLKPRRSSVKKINRDWRHFNENVSALAA